MKSMLIPFFVFFLLSPNSNAETDFYVSGLLGLGKIDYKGYGQDQYDLEVTYGLRAGLLLSEYFSTGLFIKTLSTRSGVGPETETTNIMGEFSYYRSGVKNSSFWVSGLLGVTRVKELAQTFTNGSNNIGTALGISSGYQFMINSQLSISPQLIYIYTMDAGHSDYSDLSGLINTTYRF